MNIKKYLKNLSDDDKKSLAESLGTKAIYLYQISVGFRKPSPALTLAIEKATNRQVTRYDLRPDIYPPEEQAESGR